jgi:PadR family transcriptional regulator, regulatory protein PadR
MPRHRRGWAMGGGHDCAERHSPILVSMLEPALLILIKEQPQHGYTLLAALETLGLNNLHPSVVYRILREMEDLEWICSDWNIAQTQGPPRRIYRLTEHGEGVLQNWRQELFRTNEIILELLKRIEK